LIAKEVKYYIQKVKLENSENISSEEASSDEDGIESLNESLDSDELNDNFKRAMEKQKMSNNNKNRHLSFSNLQDENGHVQEDQTEQETNPIKE
jgi:hypothetical protein